MPFSVVFTMVDLKIVPYSNYSERIKYSARITNYTRGRSRFIRGYRQVLLRAAGYSGRDAPRRLSRSSGI